MIHVTVSGSGSELQGVARLEDGRAVFIPGALPGEEAEIEITRQKDRYAEARLLRVLTPSPERVPPDCPCYESCGGCQARHMRYEEALRLKREKVVSALARLGGVKEPLVEETVPSPQISSYRNKAEFTCSGGRVGMVAEDGRQVLDAEKCLLHPDAVNALIAFLRLRLKSLPVERVVTRVNASGEMMLVLSSRTPADLTALAKDAADDFGMLKNVYFCRLRPRFVHALDGECSRILGAERLSETLCGLDFTLSPRSFFQVNRPCAELLYQKALEMAALSDTDRAADIYCGAGTISLCAARRCAHVTGIELVKEAIRDARLNAESNGLSGRTEFIAGDAALEYPRLSARRRFDAVIVDPPRKGLDRPVTEALIHSPSRRLVYVSCDPATLARDVRLLTESGAYRFEKAVPVDMFPGTSHVESVVKLIRSDMNS